MIHADAVRIANSGQGAIVAELMRLYQRATRAEQDAERRLLAIGERNIRTGDNYHELLFAVARVHENETRHETALRYITEAENVPCAPAKNAPPNSAK